MKQSLTSSLTSHNQESPLLLSIGAAKDSFNSTGTAKNTRTMTIIDDTLTKRIIDILKYAPFRFSNIFYIITVAVMIIFNSVYTVWLIFTDQDRFCPMLGWLMLSFQIESLLLYFYAYLNVDIEFVHDLVKVLSTSNINDEQDVITLFKWHMLYATLIMIFSYLSGFFIFIENTNDNKEWRAVEYISNVLDFFRYIPQVVHIALVTLFYSVFPKQILSLREKWNIPDGKSKIELDQLLNHKPLSINQHELKCEFEQIIRPYYLMTRKEKTIAWIMNYLFLNLVTMAFWWISVLSSVCRGRKMDIYYAHYAIELLSFFIGWVYVIYPFYRNQKILSRLVEDIRKITHVDIQQYIGIMIYLDGMVRKSPVSISGYKLTSYRLVKILLIVFGSVLFDVVAELNGFRMF